MIELNEIRRKKNDLKFTELLNRCRTASHTEDDNKCIQDIKDKSVFLSQGNNLRNVLHIWAGNTPVNEHNMKILHDLPKPLFVLRYVHQYLVQVTKQDIDRLLKNGQFETGGPHYEIHVKEAVQE